MDINNLIFNKINSLVGKNKLLDAFGRAGGEWVIFVMFVWFVLSGFLIHLSTFGELILPFIFLVVAWLIGWVGNIFIGFFVREYRPHISHPDKKILFTPFMNWKSFPSDHAMTAWLIFFMAMIFSLPFFLGLLPLALWVVWGRVYSGLHYPIDILGGFAMAFLLAVVSYNILLIL
jgi:undecaprenyl-diphosphatase